MKPREITIKEEGGRSLALIPLGKHHEHQPAYFAEMWKDDYDFLCRLGLSPNWNRYRQTGQGNFYVTAAATSMPGNKILVARVLLDANAGEVVRYVDGNPLNLRRENLRLVQSAKAKTRARDHVFSKSFVEVR